MTGTQFDTIIIGGGFYGLRIAQYLCEDLGVQSVLILEKDGSPMGRASYNNQARVHNGYHYPRSVLTALRSRVNLPIFTEEYREAVKTDFQKYYAVANTLSKVSAKQFFRTFDRIDAEITPSIDGRRFFDGKLIDDVFLVKEYAFDAEKLKKIMINRLKSLPVKLSVNEEATRVTSSKEGLCVQTNKTKYTCKHALNVTYASINMLNQASGLPILPLKHELTEMCLVKVPKSMENKAFTIMCGPFFSIMPFPDKNCYTLSHVRYTPHAEWIDQLDGVADRHKIIERHLPKTRFEVMKADVQRYMPEAKEMEYTGESLWEIKTVLLSSEADDSRPILFKRDHGGLKNYICIMGGKIDNIYDVFRELKEVYETDK